MPGRREGDPIVGANTSHIATLVERQSRFVMLAEVATKDTSSIVTALIRQSRKLPRERYRPLTRDRDPEMTGHVASTVATRIDVFFCDPKSPWQRGSNENADRLPRQ